MANLPFATCVTVWAPSSSNIRISTAWVGLSSTSSTFAIAFVSRGPSVVILPRPSWYHLFTASGADRTRPGKCEPIAAWSGVARRRSGAQESGLCTWAPTRPLARHGSSEPQRHDCGSNGGQRPARRREAIRAPKSDRMGRLAGQHRGGFFAGRQCACEPRRVSGRVPLRDEEARYPVPDGPRLT